MHKHLNMHFLFLILISTKKKNAENILYYIYKIAVLYLYYDSVCMFVVEVLLFFVDYFQKLTGSISSEFTFDS